MLVFTALVEILPKLLGFVLFVYLYSISPMRDVIGREWWSWLLLLFCDDFIYYWYHRLNHEVRLFWAGHVPHHSSKYYNFSTALRQGIGERLHKMIFWLPLPLLGFDPMMVLTMMALSLFYQFWIHTELIDKLPRRFEYFFNTPSHHRVHHASNIKYLDRNHGGVFIIWDRMFGTFAAEDDEVPVYGLTTDIDSFQPVYVATHEYQALWRDMKRANRLSDKIKYMLYPPGWSHDGEDMTAEAMRKSLADVSL